MSGSDTSRGTVLVVDDDAMMREVLDAILGAEGYAVRLAVSGDEALAMLERDAGEIDFVLTDMHMPGVQGAVLAKRLREVIAPETLLIGMSGSEPNADERRVFRAFLEKPFSVEAFAKAIKKARSAVDGPESGKIQVAHEAVVLDEAIFSKLEAMIPPAQLQELYRITLEDVKQRLERMRLAAESGDMTEYRAEAHAIKGGCGMVGAGELSSLAAAAEGGSEVDNIAFEQFDDACRRLQGMLNARMTNKPIES
jgi:CheY-like chemotaxis protein/HPt (histidine-containing phosphotransfer) domain-containing protein